MSFALFAASIHETTEEKMKNDFTIRRSLAHVLTLILFLVAGISEAKADQHLSDHQLRKDVESTLSAFVFDARWAKTVPDA